MENTNVNTDSCASRRGGDRPRIIIERQFTGRAELADVLIPYMVESTKKNIADMMQDGMIQNRHRTS